jgi:hypothetical protein
VWQEVTSSSLAQCCQKSTVKLLARVKTKVKNRILPTSTEGVNKGSEEFIKVVLCYCVPVLSAVACDIDLVEECAWVDAVSWVQVAVAVDTTWVFAVGRGDDDGVPGTGGLQQTLVNLPTFVQELCTQTRSGRSTKHSLVGRRCYRSFFSFESFVN